MNITDEALEKPLLSLPNTSKFPKGGNLCEASGRDKGIN